MKKIYALALACALAATISSIALAGGGRGGCSSCDQCDQNAGESAQFRQFRLNTIDLRQDMMNKRFDLQRENLKATPDAARVAALKAEIKAIQGRINDIRVQSGLPENGKRDGECFKMDGGCNKQNCNGQPCWQK